VSWRDPWLTLIGLGEDGPAGLSAASREALARAEVIFGGPRHLALVGAGERGQAWPVPFDVAPVLAMRGRAVVVLASGDPFWFGAGGSLMAHLAAGEWVSHPAPSTFPAGGEPVGMAAGGVRLPWPACGSLCPAAPGAGAGGAGDLHAARRGGGGGAGGVAGRERASGRAAGGAGAVWAGLGSGHGRGADGRERPGLGGHRGHRSRAAGCLGPAG
jgi:hypothetical protein